MVSATRLDSIARPRGRTVLHGRPPIARLKTSRLNDFANAGRAWQQASPRGPLLSKQSARQSPRKATAGSVEAARRAGSRQAPAATVIRIAAAPACAVISSGV